MWIPLLTHLTRTFQLQRISTKLRVKLLRQILMIIKVQITLDWNLPKFKLIKESLFLYFRLERRYLILPQIRDHVHKRLPISVQKHSILMFLQLMLPREHPAQGRGGKLGQSRSRCGYSLIPANQQLDDILLVLISLHVLVAHEVCFDD